MTKLEELKAALDNAYVVARTERQDRPDPRYTNCHAYAAWAAAENAYEAELKKTKESSND